MKTDELFMHRCLELASLGWPKCSPNPMVGSVIVYDGEIIGEGYHQRFGASHAEVNAINMVKDDRKLAAATLYVNLEPCSHHGKTPPCADLIIKKKIKKVVIGTIDSTSKVCGKGIKRMQDAGIEVVTGVLEKESRDLNKRFFCVHEKNRPYIILKWAESGDGFIDKTRLNDRQKSAKISNPLSQQMVHLWRTEEASILVGGRTIRLDNPQLNVRLVKGPNPLRIIISPSGDMDESSLVLIDGQPTIIFNQDRNESEGNVEWIKIDYQETDWLNRMLAILFERDIQSILVEGGTKTHNTFLLSGIWDEIRRIKSDKVLLQGVPAPDLSFASHHEVAIGSDLLMYYYQDKSE